MWNINKLDMHQIAVFNNRVAAANRWKDVYHWHCHRHCHKQHLVLGCWAAGLLGCTMLCMHSRLPNGLCLVWINTARRWSKFASAAGFLILWLRSANGDCSFCQQRISDYMCVYKIHVFVVIVLLLQRVAL